MDNRIDSIYARQSVDKKDSISIDSQIEFCKFELKGGSCKEFTDKGFSGKNTDRPRFQEMIRDIEQGLIKRVIVYKLDRISRSIIDFSNMMELFLKYNVEFVSCTEKFDTSTPMGRAMLNICIVFAQLERETIQMRVTDNYYARCEKGLHASGKAPYGYKLTPTVIDGIKTKMLEIVPEAAERVRLMFEMYAEPETSLGEIVRYFASEGLDFRGNELERVRLSNLLRNPAYAQADLDLYEFFKAQGAAIVNEATDFTGTNGCYLYQGRDVDDRKTISLQDQILVIAPHDGIISSEKWLQCRRKLMGNVSFAGVNKKAKNTWLAGKIKCGRCGTALVYQNTARDIQYFRCRKRTDRKTCEGCGPLHVCEVERYVYEEMRRKISDFKTLTGGNFAKANPKLTKLNVELAQVESDIEKLLDTLTGANTMLLTYANSKITELDAKRQSLIKAIADMSAEAVSPDNYKRISGHLDNWDNVTFEDKRLVVDGMISSIQATSDNYQISWKFC